MGRWLTSSQFAAWAGITPQAARKRLKRALICAAPIGIQVRVSIGRGGRSGLHYEVLESSLSEPSQNRLSDLSAGDNLPALAKPAPLSKFIAAPGQDTRLHQRHRVLRFVMETEPGTAERAASIADAARHHGKSERTIYNWVKRCEAHGWDLDAFCRKRPSDAGRKRVHVSRGFDNAFLSAGYTVEELSNLATWLTRNIAGWWQSPVQRAGWKRVRLEALTSLRRECRKRSYTLPGKAFTLSRRKVEELRFHQIVDIRQNDAKRYDDTKPRIRRDNSQFMPMQQIVMDVKPLDCVLMRPDGSLAYPKLIGFMDTGTHRLFGRIILLPQGEGVRQEHVTSAFLDMVEHPEWGFPQQLYCDNGSEYAHFSMIRDALAMIADEGARVLIKARPYSGASKPIESKFAVIDRQITALMDGYTGSNRMDKKVQRVGKAAKPYSGTVEDFEPEFLMRLADFQAQEIGSGPFKGRSPMQVYHDHVANGWRPVAVNRLALDCAFARQLGDRKIDRGVLSIDGQRFRHPELAAFTGRRVRVVKPYRREAWPLADLPGIGWIALEPEMLSLPGEIDGAHETSRLQRKRNQTVTRLKAAAEKVLSLENICERVASLPTAAAPAPLIDVLMSPEAERFAGARIQAEARRAEAPSAEEQRIARQLKETELLEKQIAARN